MINLEGKEKIVKIEVKKPKQDWYPTEDIYEKYYGSSRGNRKKVRKIVDKEDVLSGNFSKIPEPSTDFAVRELDQVILPLREFIKGRLTEPEIGRKYILEVDNEMILVSIFRTKQNSLRIALKKRPTKPSDAREIKHYLVEAFKILWKYEKVKRIVLKGK